MVYLQNRQEDISKSLLEAEQQLIAMFDAIDHVRTEFCWYIWGNEDLKVAVETAISALSLSILDAESAYSVVARILEVANTRCELSLPRRHPDHVLPATCCEEIIAEASWQIREARTTLHRIQGKDPEQDTKILSYYNERFLDGVFQTCRLYVRREFSEAFRYLGIAPPLMSRLVPERYTIDDFVKASGYSLTSVRAKLAELQISKNEHSKFNKFQLIRFLESVVANGSKENGISANRKLTELTGVRDNFQ